MGWPHPCWHGQGDRVHLPRAAGPGPVLYWRDRTLPGVGGGLFCRLVWCLGGAVAIIPVPRTASVTVPGPALTGGLRSLRPAPPLSMVRVLFWGGGGWVMRGPGGDGWPVLSQSEDQSRVHLVPTFVRSMSTQVRSPGPEATGSGPRSDPQNATHPRNQDDRQAATYPAHRIRPPGPARTHARRRGTPSVPGPHPDKRGRHPTTRTHARRDKGRSAPSPRPAPTPDPHQETRDPRPAYGQPPYSPDGAGPGHGPAPQPVLSVPRAGLGWSSTSAGPGRGPLTRWQTGRRPRTGRQLARTAELHILSTNRDQ